jgi:plasmid maintenance system killer protein
LPRRREIVADLALPGLRPEKLSGDRKGQYSIRINRQYRVCFQTAILNGKRSISADTAMRLGR